MDPVRKVEYEIHRAKVAEQIFCEATGVVLDVRTAVFVYGSRGNLVSAVSPEGYRLRKDVLLAAIPGVSFKNAPPD